MPIVLMRRKDEEESKHPRHLLKPENTQKEGVSDQSGGFHVKLLNTQEQV